MACGTDDMANPVQKVKKIDSTRSIAYGFFFFSLIASSFKVAKHTKLVKRGFARFKYLNEWKVGAGGAARDW